MKAMKYILIVIGLVSILTAKANIWGTQQEIWNKQPEACMHTTSAMQLSGTTLPQAAATGAYTTYDQTNAPSGPRRIIDEDDKEDKEDNDWAEPGLPLGDAVLPLLLLAAGYAVYVARRKRVAAER
jgi:hypothetical protein